MLASFNMKRPPYFPYKLDGLALNKPSKRSTANAEHLNNYDFAKDYNDSYF